MLAFSVSATAQRWQSSQPFHSEKLSQDLPYAVVLPAGYEANPEARYPVVYLTHGIGCTPDDWNDKYIQFENTLTQPTVEYAVEYTMQDQTATILTPSWQVDGETVWGLTGRVIASLLETGFDRQLDWYYRIQNTRN